MTVRERSRAEDERFEGCADATPPGVAFATGQVETSSGVWALRMSSCIDREVPSLNVEPVVPCDSTDSDLFPALPV